MTKALIIVESPAKIKTLKKFLGPKYLFESSIGHVRDLPEKEFGIDIEHNFEPKYVVMSNKKEVIAKLKKAAKSSDVVYLAPDPDREGEAIAWHISQLLPADTNIQRISFNAITKEAVLSALSHPRSIDMALVNAQQARRLLDRIVGYKISPLLNRRIHRGKDEGFVSAGRVQSVALKLIVDREKEIRAFKPIEYWNIGAILKTDHEERTFRASLFSVDGKKVEKEPVEGKEITLIGDKKAADDILKRLKGKDYQVEKVEKKEKKRNPVPPFITSTLQQEASRHYGFSSAKTMSIAQGLYEGIDLGADGPEGLITYMRTDSVRIAPEAITEVRRFIQKEFGQEYLPAEPKYYSTQKSAQDAHEAIRPASLHYPPNQIEPYLTKEQMMLYLLIWRRFVASQMVPAVYDTVSADIQVDETILMRVTGSVMKFAGFLAVYEEKEDDENLNEEDRSLPDLQEGQLLQLLELTSEQSFTRPPPRYSEASLVKELERLGIGRPSTYSAIMNKIQSREYSIKESGRLKPTELGEVIAQMLEANFQQIMDVGFTANMEDELERVAENKKDWKKLLQEFWSDFSPTYEVALQSAVVPKIMTDIDCPKCGAKLQKIWSRSKYFYGCSNYPDCDYSAPAEEIAFNKEDYAPNFDWDQRCPVCQSEMKVRHGKYGAFLGCTRYPDCKGIVNIPRKGEKALPTEDMPPCPANDCPGQMVARRSRFGKIFYSCSTYPECDVIVNNLDQLETKYVNHPRTPYTKAKTAGKGRGKKTEKKTKTTKATKTAKSAKTTKTIKKTRVSASKKLSKELTAIVGSDQLSRGEVLKELWVYIKKHNLQDSKNKRQINPDEKLAKVFGNKSFDMMKIASLIKPHLEGDGA